MRIKSFFRNHKKPIIITSVVVLSIMVVLGTYLGIGFMRIKQTMSLINSDVAFLKNEQSQKSFPGIKLGLEKLQPDISRLQGNVQYFEVFKYVPILSGYYNNAIHALNALSYADSGAIKIVDASEPIADSLGYGSAPVNGSAKIAAFVNGLPVLSQAINVATPDLNNADNELKQINPSYVPSISVKGINLRDALVTYGGTLEQFIGFLPQIGQLSPTIQLALGDPNPQNYLLLLQNDKELRPDGGFITAYGYLYFDHGNLGQINTNDIYNLPNDTLNLNAPVQLQEYNSANRWFLRDVNLSPDIPTSSIEVEKFYNSIPRNQREGINGIVYIDTQFIASLLDAIGPVYIPQYKQTVTSQNAAYEMEYYSEKVDVHKTDRKGFVNLLMETIKGKVFSAQKDSLIKLIQISIDDFNQKHIALYTNDPGIEGVINKYNWGGTFPQITNSDYFAMVEANLGGAKADFYIKRDINQTIQKTSSGYLKTVKITFTNNQVYDDWLNGPYRAWVRFYIPLGSKLVSIQNVDGTLRQYNELGYSVIDDHIRVPVKYKVTDPAATLTVTLKYYLPDSLTSIIDNGYSLYMFKQPGVEDMNVEVQDPKGKSQNADILSDKIFSF